MWLKQMQINLWNYMNFTDNVYTYKIQTKYFTLESLVILMRIT